MRRYIYSMLLTAMCAVSVYAEVASFGIASDFNKDWMFMLGDDSLAYRREYVDTLWRKLDLPHDWSIEGQLSPTLASCTGYLPGGIGWYRKTFTLDENDNQPKHYIYFEGVYNRSDVYVNGHHLGHRPNGYVSFMYDLTPYLNEGENTIAVRVDHSRYADSRWYTGSGIYRDVYLISAPESHFALWGVGYKALSITDKAAKLEVSAKVENARKGMTVEALLYDATGKKVASASGKLTADSASMVLDVKKPHRWDVDEPYLYKLVVNLKDGKNIVDTDVERVGLRTLHFDPNTGFALNGKNMKVKGVCLHHDAGVLGAVVPRDVWKRRLKNLKAIGANAIRTSHNPQAPVVYDLCDELGFLVMDEISDEWEFPKRKWVEGWNNGTPNYDGTYDFFEEWIERDVTDMVSRDRNHPCIFLWSIGNEVDYPNDPYSHPILDGTEISQPMYGGYNPEAPRAERIGVIAKRLARCVKAVDTSRPTTGALAGVVMSNQTEYPEAVDVVGYNYTEGQYAPDHAAYPDRIIYGSETSVRYDSWQAVRDNDFIFGQFVWTGTDYLGESRKWPSRGLHTGLLDFGSFPKPRGYFRASLWSDKPTTYIGTYPMVLDTRREGANVLSIEAPAVWNYEPDRGIRVVCYTNAPYAKLMLNGRQVGEMKPYDDSTGIIYWDIPFEEGTLVGVGCDAEGNTLSEYSITTCDRPYKLDVCIDGDYTAEPGGVNHLLVRVLDENDNEVVLADNEIKCKVVGDGKLLGLEGSNNSDMSDYTDSRHRAYLGRLLAYVKNGDNPQGLRVVFTSPLLKSAEIVLGL